MYHTSHLGRHRTSRRHEIAPDRPGSRHAVQWRRSIALGCALALWLSCATPPIGAAPPSKNATKPRTEPAATSGIPKRRTQTQLPNILWLTSEDNGPQLGCYGDRYATTPNLDALAAKGMIYRVCWSNAPVCAPARTAIISGVYPTSTGSEHMRSLVPMPHFMRMYPQFLRDRGYYCTNNSKEDYNLEKPGKVWDESSRKAHWKNRAPGQPFFAIFNFTISHESQIRKRPHKWVHDPAKVRVPAYHPDVKEAREDWAQYYDQLTLMDREAGARLRELEQAGLADDTIVFYYGDHGPGMPRCKRWPYDSGLHVPLIVYIPDKFAHLRPPEYRPGGTSDRLVSFVDLAPTLLSLAGIEPPDWMQGQAFLGPFIRPPREYIFGFRGRMDERYDMVRSVRDQRYIYIRNYMPHRIYGQYIAYMFQTPTTRVWKELYDQGKLTPPRTYFWEPKPSEELYDLQSDPDEVHNLADSPGHRHIKNRLRTALHHWMRQVRDVGFLPEDEMHRRAAGTTPYEIGHDPKRYDFDRVFETAELATFRDPASTSELSDRCSDRDAAVRYWAATGLLIRGRDGTRAARPVLRRLLEDPSPNVRIVAAEALGKYGDPSDVQDALRVLLRDADLRNGSLYASIAALNALDQLDAKASPFVDRIRQLPARRPDIPGRLSGYVPRLLEKILADLAPH